MQSVPIRSSLSPVLKCAACLLLFSLHGYAIGQAKITPGLVDKLATTNSPFIIRGKPGREEATEGEQFALSEFKRINTAVRDAIRQSETLWSELVDHLGDERHCKTVGIDAGYPKNWSVGDVCQHIIGETLSVPFYRHLPGTKANYRRFKIPAIAKDKGKLREWCLARKDRKLFELQIELCEWAITEIKASDMDLEEKQRISTAIKKEIEGLQKSQAAIRCTSSF